MRLLSSILCLFFMVSARADIYITVGGNGGGGSCAAAASWTSVLGNAANWTPGQVFRLCGTNTFGADSTPITTLGGGTSGSRITIKFETGAVIQAPYFHGAIGREDLGAIVVQHPYITIDGGTNGLIQTTANGTLLANQKPNNGFGTNSSAHHLLITGHGAVHNLYAYVAQGNDQDDYPNYPGNNQNGISVWGDQTVVEGWTWDHMTNGLSFGSGVCGITAEFRNNKTSYMNWHYGVGVATNGCNLTALIHDNEMAGGNDIYDCYKTISPPSACDPSSNGGSGWIQYHHNGVHAYATSGVTSSVNLQFYNNYTHGKWSSWINGTLLSAIVFAEGQSASTVVNGRIYNNVFQVDAGSGAGADGLVFQGYGTMEVYNNTFVQLNGNIGACWIVGGGTIVKNNIMQTCGYAGSTNGMGGNPPAANIDYNVYYNDASWWMQPPDGLLSWSQWRGKGYDTHGINNSDPKLNQSSNPLYQLQAGSSAIGVGANLSSLGISTLNIDRLGRSRGSVWDIGAYQFGAPVCSISPTSLPNYTAGQAVSLQFTQSGCNSSTFTVAAGSLVGSGLSLSSSGLLSGTAVVGTFNFTVGYDTAADPLSLTISPASAPAVSLDSVIHNFGSVMVGVQSTGFAIHLQNTGNAALSIRSINPNGDFGSSSNCPISPGTLGIGSSCTITATFTPAQTGARAGSIVVSDDATDSPQTISLSGTGLAAQTGSLGTGISAGQVIIR